MPVTLTTHKGKKVSIDDKPFNSGGQGGVYHFTGKQQNLVAKIFYHDTPEKFKKTKKLEPRIKFMVEHSPIKNSNLNIQNTLIWPRELLYDNGDFVGFTMPIAGDTSLKEIPVKLSCFCKIELNHSIKKLSKWKKFKRSEKDSLNTRLKLCYNIAQAVNALHSTKSYILVDFKPDNILINSNGWMSIIDLDSIQISKNNNVLFQAEAFTEEYIPPEYQKKLSSITKTKKNESWDRFCYAVLAYQLILGIHPFTASHKQFHSTTEFIREGLFPNGKQKNKLISIPPPHNAFSNLPKEVQDLFLRCFETGYQYPSKRPTLKEWADTLFNIIHKPSKIYWFKANKTIRNNHEPIRLSWRVENSKQIKLNGQLIKGKNYIDVLPTKETTYILEAYSQHKIVSSKITIQIDKTPPKITFFKIDKPLLNNHLPATLKWSTERALKIEISKIGDVTGKTNYKVNPKRDTEYSLTVIGFFGQILNSKLKVQVSKKPPNIKFFNSNISHRINDSKVRLNWSISDAYKIYIDKIGNVSKLNSINVDPRCDTVYNLKAISFFGVESKAQAKITVSKNAPQILKFQFENKIIQENKISALVWKVENAENIWVNNIKQNDLNGKIYIKPIKKEKYLLVAKTLFGIETSAEASTYILKKPEFNKYKYPFLKIKRKI